MTPPRRVRCRWRRRHSSRNWTEFSPREIRARGLELRCDAPNGGMLSCGAAVTSTGFPVRAFARSISSLRVGMWKWLSEFFASVIVSAPNMDIRIRIRLECGTKVDISEFVFPHFSISDSTSVFDNIRNIRIRIRMST